MSPSCRSPRGAAALSPVTLTPPLPLLVVVMMVVVLPLATVAASAGSDASPRAAARGVSLPFVFDPRARCEPPCLHHGLCIRNDTCFCGKGFEGERCQFAQCYPKCKNNGQCLRPGKCRCLPGYGGRYCHKAVCEGGCLNGGECVPVHASVKCSCKSGWVGTRCQDGLPQRWQLRDPGHLQLPPWLGGRRVPHGCLRQTVPQRRQVRGSGKVPLPLTPRRPSVRRSAQGVRSLEGPPPPPPPPSHRGPTSSASSRVLQ
uniref:Neurogenic locus notch homolog protein 3-like isoform X1 n=1 Tax=Petromyzon marinus TaxID=7757 RepID=A0AAJ7X6A7_PETMA|nr:neurogenic locus notch homolog protein 3-like isoform X1 [Petromyzon marinus]